MTRLKKNAIEPDDAAVDRAGMPSVGRKKRSGKMMNILVLAGIGGIGLTLAVMTSGASNHGAAKPKLNTEEVANHLAPLPPPDAPPPLPDTPPPLLAARPAPAPATPPEKHELTWQERKMGATETDGTLATSAAAGMATVSGAASNAMDGAGEAIRPATAAAAAAPGSLAARLESTVFQASYASMMPDRNYVIAAGTLLDCILDTRIDSTLPGLVKCHLNRDQYSDNKQVLLMEKGTDLLGETAGGILHGQARQFVVFTQAKTPNGVRVAINSPATDALGASGIEGWVDTQFGKRFGAAIAIALVQDLTAVAVASQSSGSGGQNTLVLGNTAHTGGELAEKTLEASVNIPPILHVNQGAHIQVMLARDLIFDRVYALKGATP